MDEAKKVFDRIKRNGEFDKCKREVLAKVMDGECMKRSIEECDKLVSRVINNLPNAGITKLREIVRTGARQHHLLNPLYIQTEKLLREYESSSKLNELFEDVARAEMNLPPRDSNIEIVDMEVSSGPSSIASTCSSSLSNNGANNAEGSGADAPNPEEFDKSKDVLDDENESIPLDSILCPPPPPMQPNAPIKTKPAIHHSNEPTQPGVKRPLNDPIINDEDADQAGSSETKRPRF